MRYFDIIKVARDEYLDDSIHPYHWSDAYLTLLGQEAEKEAVRRGKLILEKTKITENDAYSGTATSTTAGALVDASAAFVSTTVSGLTVYNITKNAWSPVSAWVSGTHLTLTYDIMTSGDVYIIGDASKPLTRICVIEGTRDYALSQKVIKINACRLASDNRPLHKKTDGYYHLPGGIPQFYNEDENSISLIPTPNHTLNHSTGKDTLILSVFRMPLTDWDIKSQRSPEISDRYHLGLVDWICHLAYSKQDAETYDPNKAALHAQRFAEKFGNPVSASVENVVRVIPNMLRVGARWGH